MKLTQGFKKVLALTIGASMTASLLTGLSVSAHPFSQPDVINVFDAMQGYSKSFGQQSPELPASLVAQRWMSQTYATASETTTDGDTYMKIVKDTEKNYDGANMTWVFDEVIRKGNITISFDMKFPWDATANDKNPYFYIERVPNLVNDNPTDYFLEEGTDGNPKYDTEHRHLMTINESDISDGVISAGPNSTGNADMSKIGTGWNKFTIVYNAETGLSVLYMNGNEISQRNCSNDGTKRINIITHGRTKAVDNEILIDNIYIRHSQSKIGEIPAKADYAKNGVKQNGGVVKMAFAETLNVLSAESGCDTKDFVLKDSNGEIVENRITNVVQDSAKPELKFTLGDLSKGLYTISLSESAKTGEFADSYKGKLSGKFPSAITFSTEGEAQNKQDVRRYYVNENFEGYNGGVPNGAISNLYGYSNAKNMTKKTDDSTHNSTIAISATDRAIWKFDESIKGGVFNIEFDVKSNGKNWGINLIKARDFLPENYVPGDYWETLYPGNKDGTQASHIQVPTKDKDLAQCNYYDKKLKEAETATDFNKDTWLVNNWVSDWRTYRASNEQDAVNSRYESRQASVRNSYVLGVGSNGTQYKYSESRNQHSSWGPTEVAGKDSTFPAPTSDWTHIKVKVDTEAAKYYLTVRDKTVELPYNQYNFNIAGSTNAEDIPGYATSYDIKTGKLKVTPGFGGIGLYAEATADAPVQFDNVQVYTDDSYNSYSTFDNAARGTLTADSTTTNATGVDMPDWFYPEGLNTSYVKRDTNGLSLAYGDGRNKAGNSSDRSLLINCSKTGAGSLLHMLNVPIKSGREFNVEFDYKCDQEQSFILGLVESGNILPYSFNQYNKLDGQDLSGKTEDTKATTGKWDNANKYTSRGILYNRSGVDREHPGDSAEAGDRFRFRNGTNGYYDFGEADMKDAVYNNDATKTIGYTKGKWHHIKLNVKPNGKFLQETLTVKYEDGTLVTSQAYDTKLSSANDIAALMFKFNNAKKFVSKNNAQHFIDNLAVYEVGDVNNTYLTNVSAIDADGTESVINGSCMATTKQLKLNFSGKLASANGISITTDNAEKALTPTYTLSNDKMSVLVTFNRALLPSEKISISVGAGLDAERDSYLQRTEPYSTNITVAEAEGELKLAEARLYKWVDSRTYTSSDGNITSTEGYYPMGAEVLNDVKSTDKFKLVVKGTNFSGSDYPASIMQCVYDSNNRLIDVIITKDDTTKINQGVFDISKDNITCANANAAKIKFYVWRDNTLIPVANYLDYDVTTTAAEQPTE